MPRPRRAISADGYLYCSRGNHTVHIRNFYPQRTNSVWFVLEDPETGECESFGKPMSWCKDCTLKYQAEARKNPPPPVVTENYLKDPNFLVLQDPEVQEGRNDEGTQGDSETP